VAALFIGRGEPRGARGRGSRGGGCALSPTRPEVGDGGGSHLRGPRVSGCGWQMQRASGARARALLRGWAAALRAAGAAARPRAAAC